VAIRLLSGQDKGEAEAVNTECCRAPIRPKARWYARKGEMTVSDLVKWLLAQYARHGELEDKLAADEIEKYEKWFSDNAAMLATHRMGGFEFETEKYTDEAVAVGCNATGANAFVTCTSCGGPLHPGHVCETWHGHPR
jgi:hypothetical protein